MVHIKKNPCGAPFPTTFPKINCLKTEQFILGSNYILEIITFDLTFKIISLRCDGFLSRMERMLNLHLCQRISYRGSFNFLYIPSSLSCCIWTTISHCKIYKGKNPFKEEWVPKVYMRKCFHQRGQALAQSVVIDLQARLLLLALIVFSL